jgi:hypothetical protein
MKKKKVVFSVCAMMVFVLLNVSPMFGKAIYPVTPRYNSYLPDLPGDRYLDDFNGDGYTEMALIPKGKRTFKICKVESYKPEITHYNLGSNTKRVIVGCFLGNGRDQIVIIDAADNVKTFQLADYPYVLAGAFNGDNAHYDIILINNSRQILRYSNDFYFPHCYNGTGFRQGGWKRRLL